jgi:hypothetical protein
MGKSAKRVKVLRTKSTRIEVTTTRGKPDYISIWTAKDTMLEMGGPGLARLKPETKGESIPSGSELFRLITKAVKTGSGWADAISKASNLAKG